MKKTEKLLFSLGGLTQQDVTTMVKKYYTWVSKMPGFDPDSYIKSVWFGIDEITYIQSQLTTEGGDGVRVYFGSYPPSDSTGKPFPNPGTNTVIFVSTKPALGNTHADYFTETEHINPQDRGEQCQPNCSGTIPTP